MTDKKGKNVTIKGILYEEDSPSIYHDERPLKRKFEAPLAETASQEVASQVTTGGLQALTSSISTQAANLGASGLIAVGSAGAFQVEHIHDNWTEAHQIAKPMVLELSETGTIVPPPGSSYEGQEIPVTETVFGVPVGEYKKQIEAEKNKTDEEKAIEKSFQDAVKPPQPGDDEKDSSITSTGERDRTLT